MRRREFLTLGGGASIWPLAAGAQQKGVPLIGVLMIGTSRPEDDVQGLLGDFVKALEDLGWTEGKTVRLEVRWAGSEPASVQRHAAELAALKPDVILANGHPSVVALSKATKSIPIVCAMVQDPVGTGLITSLARPGGNITGFTYTNPELIGKWAALLREVAPSATTAGLFFNPTYNPYYYNFLRDLGPRPNGAINVVAAPVEDVEALRAAMENLGGTGVGAAIIAADAFLFAHGKETASLALQHRLPTISVFRPYATLEGGLMSYGPDVNEVFRRSASYVNRLLKGESPAELPMQQPDKFKLSLNLSTAKALGLTVPPTLLVLANEVVE